MTVPVLTEKNLPQSGQWNGMVLWVQRRARSLRQCGQRTPAGQRPSMNQAIYREACAFLDEAVEAVNQPRRGGSDEDSTYLDHSGEPGRSRW